MIRTRTALGVFALALCLAAPVIADGGVPVGAEAPDFEAGGFINTEPVKLSELKGRLILLELFSTT